MAITKKIFPSKYLAITLVPAGLISVLAAALVTAIYLAASGTIPLTTVVPAMLGWHLWIGLIEGGATLAFIAIADRRILYSPIRPSAITEVTNHAA
ncbi:hypothetical protein D3C78_1765830 [compost metagenome]